MAYPSNCDTLQYNNWTDFAIAPQVQRPSCIPEPPACVLGFNPSSIVSTAVSVRGGSDGTIAATVTGATGATIVWSINGVVDAGTALSHTFTGLEAGYYTILAEESECYVQEENIYVVEGSFRTGTFIINEPSGNLQAVNNPVPFTIRTALDSGNPQPSKTYLEVDQDVDDGFEVRFRLNYPSVIDVTLTAKSFPNRDEYFLATDTTDQAGTPVTTNTKAEVAQSLGAAIEKNTELGRLYTVYVSGVYVYLTAKENNQGLDLTWDKYNDGTGTVWRTGGRIEVHPTQGGQAAYDGSLTENYSIYADIFVQPNATYGLTPDIANMTKVAQLELPFQQNNVHRFNLAPILSSFVSTPKLDWNLSGFTTVAPYLCAYQVQYGEKYPLVPNTNTKKSRYKGQSSLNYVANAALEWEEVNDMQDYLGEKLHNLNPSFSWIVTPDTPTSQDSEVEFTNWLYDTGITATTNIGFRITDSYGGDHPWQTGTTFTVNGGVSYPYPSQGYLYVSGSTNGAVVQYRRRYYILNAYDYWNLSAAQQPVGDVSNVQFLTDTPQVKTMQRDGSDWLYIMLPRDYGKPLKVKADLYFYDGSTALNQELYDVHTGTTNAGGCFMFGSGYEQLGLEAYETSGGTSRKIRRVDFALYQSDAVNGDYLFSEVRSYRYEIDEQVSTFEIGFLNRRGTFDTFTFIGEIIDNVERTTGKYEVPLNINQDGSVPRGFMKNSVYDTKTVSTVKANSGWLDSDHRDWLVSSLLSSNRIYQITQGDENFVTIKSVQESEKSSNNSLFQLNVTFELTIYENNVNV